MVIPAPLLVASPAPSKCVVRPVPTDLVEPRCLFDVLSAKCAVMAVRVGAMRMFPPVRSRSQTLVISLAHTYAFITNHYRLLSRCTRPLLRVRPSCESPLMRGPSWPPLGLTYVGSRARGMPQYDGASQTHWTMTKRTICFALAAALAGASAARAQSTSSQSQQQGESAPAPVQPGQTQNRGSGGEAAESDDTLEIPIAVKAGPPALDQSFVGDWCGIAELVSADHVVPRTEALCVRFRTHGGSLTLRSPTLAERQDIQVKLISFSAYSVSAHEIVSTAILGLSIPGSWWKKSRPRGTEAITNEMALTSAEAMAFSSKLQSPVGTSRWAGSLHRAEPKEVEAIRPLIWEIRLRAVALRRMSQERTEGEKQSPRQIYQGVHAKGVAHSTAPAFRFWG